MEIFSLKTVIFRCVSLWSYLRIFLRFFALPISIFRDRKFRREKSFEKQLTAVLVRSNKMQQYAGIYLLQVYSTCFGRPTCPSSGVQKTVTAASGTGHIA